MANRNDSHAQLSRRHGRVGTFADPRFALVTAVAVALWFPLTTVDWFQEFDAGNYVPRAVEWAQELRAGHLYPRWAPDMYGGYGEPLFVFFAPAVYAVVGLLTALSIDPVVGLKLVALVGSLLAGAGVYALVRGEARDPDAALLAAISYLAAPYRLADVFVRGDFSEFFCIALLPVVLALYLAAAREPGPRRARALAVCGSFAHGLMILTHTILGLWGSLLVGLVVGARCVLFIRAGAWRRAPLLVVAVGCAPCLAGAYVIPAMAYRSLTHTEALVARYYKPQNHLITFRDLFTGRSYAGYSPNFNRVGALIAVAVAIVAIGLVLNFKRGRSALPWLLLSLACVALSLRESFPFWEPGRLALAQFIQFPWRLLGPAVLLAAIALGFAATAAGERLAARLKTSLAIAGSAALLLFIAWPYAAPSPISNQTLSEPTLIRMGVASATSADEFLPKRIPVPPSRARTELVSSTEHVDVQSSWSDGSRHELAVNATAANSALTLAVYGFPGWQIQMQSGPGADARLDTDSSGLLRVAFPSSGQYRFTVAYGQPPLSWVGLTVTVLAIIILGSLLVRGFSWRDFYHPYG